MKRLIKIAATGVAIVGMAAASFAGEKVRMATIAPGSSAYLVMTTMASSVNGAQDKYDITVDATGAATKHMIEAAQGKLDIVMASPAIMDFMANGTAMYGSLPNAPELRENLSLLFWFPYGAYHTVVYADSGINTLQDIKGKRVFLGPPGGGAYNTAAGWIKATTGFEAGTDYEAVKASWGTALQGFQDRQFDVYINGGIPPFPQIEQLALTSNLRILGLSKANADVASVSGGGIQAATTALGRSMDVIPAGIYGNTVQSDGDVYTVGSLVGVVARNDMSEDAVYEITKSFWESLPEIRKTAPYMNAVNLDTAFSADNVKLHAGALKYYQQLGVRIPAALQ
ncbi:C4-dicarboxylate ABC transporter substrate-binding protein [Amylibacter ulvae]|uniref:C4-dicarboxylate ABC transporter substrate-binding protein n=1 Tax=Paramylibacter ulvae TaxID=1651968 RepID=A0ABQ3D3U4_9RHOB|nr:TAXI family TRAP transporter solute-binding subunit [Amylibacter ulvae]GHA57411.1 C4-dicarboxylate ABC transporter substrate-binding protein [Amylibacter ulvae]